MTIRYTQLELDALRDGLAAGKSVARIAREIGRDANGLYARSLMEGWRKRKSEMFCPKARALALKHYAEMSNADLSRLTGLRVDQIKNLAIREELRKSPAYMERTGHLNYFEPGQAPWNKGKRHAPDGSRATQFKAGELNGRAKRLFCEMGTEHVRGDGILYRKVATTGVQGKDWVPVHRIVWDSARGAPTEGHVVVFKPGKKTAVREHITLDRLECITRADNMRRNSHYNRYPPEVAGLIQLRGALNRKIRNRTRGEVNEHQ